MIEIGGHLILVLSCKQPRIGLVVEWFGKVSGLDQVLELGLVGFQSPLKNTMFTLQSQLLRFFGLR